MDEQTTPVSYPTDSQGRRTGLAASFSRFNADMLMGMRADLSLTMTVEDLQYLQKHFSTQEKRDPYLDEIYFFDDLVRRCRTTYASAAITAATIRHPDVTETYRDLLEKNRVLPFSEVPLTVARVLRVASMYLNRIGIAPISRALGFDEAERPLFTYGATQESAVSFGALPEATPKKSLPPKTALVLLCAKKECADPDKARRSLLSSPFGKAKILMHKTVEPAGIAVTVCRMAKGVFLDLNPLPPLTCPDFSALSGAFAGEMLVALATEEVSALLAQADALGLQAYYCAGVLADSHLTIRMKNGNQITYQSELLTALADSMLQVCAETPEENLLTVLSHTPLLLHPDCPVFAPKALSAPLTADGKCFSVVATDADENPFSVGVNTLLNTLLPLLAQGISHQKISLSLRFSIPTEDTSPAGIGRALSLMLGAYRVMMELCITDVNSVICPAKDGKYALHAVAFAATSKQENASHTVLGAQVYLLSFRRTPTGLPDFADFRAMCKTVSDLHRKKKPIAALPVSGRVSDAVRSLDGTTHTLRLFPEADVYMNAYLQGFLVQSTEPIPEGIALGEVIPLAKNESETAAEEQKASSKSCRRYPTPSVVIPYADQAPQYAASRITAMGASCLCLPLSECDALTDAIAKAQVVVLTAPTAHLAQNGQSPRMATALSDMLANQGTLLLVGKAKIEDPVLPPSTDLGAPSGLIRTENRLSEAEFASLLHFYQ